MGNANYLLDIYIRNFSTYKHSLIFQYFFIKITLLIFLGIECFFCFFTFLYIFFTWIGTPVPDDVSTANANFAILFIFLDIFAWVSYSFTLTKT